MGQEKLFAHPKNQLNDGLMRISVYERSVITITKLHPLTPYRVDWKSLNLTTMGS